MPVPAPVTISTLTSPSEPTLFGVIGGEHDEWFAVGADVTPTHSGRGERHHHRTAGVEANDAAFTPNRLQLTVNDVVGGGLDGHAAILDACADVVRHRVADPE